MGGKSDAPAPPDYIGQANAQAAGNLQAARATTSANRIDQVTPYGSIKYTQGNGFNQEGYDQAIAQYAATAEAFNDPSNAQMAQYRAAGGKMPAEPKRDDFIINPDRWSSQIQLSDTGQQLLDADSRARLGYAGLQDSAMDRVRAAQAQPFDTSGIPDWKYNVDSATGMDSWDKASSLIMERLNPDLNTQQSALDTKLANQGLTAGSEGWGIGQQQFARQRNDANIGAQLAGAQLQGQMYDQALKNAALNNTSRGGALQERAYLRQLPMNELNALRTGSQVTNPTFSTPGQQGQTSGPDLMGASQAGYNAQVGQVNASNAAASQQTQAGIGLAGLAVAAFF